MLSLWQRLPVVVRAILAGLAVSTAGVLPWAFFVQANQLLWLSVPWAILPTGLYMWFFWRYLRGEGWPAATSQARRTSMRAHSLSGDVWGAALFAGMLGLMALLPLAGLLARLVRLPSEAQPIKVPPEMPSVTVFVLLLAASLVAGIVEETAFRGYMQGPLERRHGPIVALLTTGVVFGSGHFLHHPAGMLPMLPFYLAVAAVYGGLAYFTNSILPSLVLHAGGDVFSLTRLWITGQPEWQMAASPPPLIWESGPDAAFWGYLTAFILLGAFAIASYAALAAVTRDERRAAGAIRPALPAV